MIPCFFAVPSTRGDQHYSNDAVGYLCAYVVYDAD